ncbi:hypothetical protein [Niabella aquatica]
MQKTKQLTGLLLLLHSLILACNTSPKTPAPGTAGADTAKPVENKITLPEQACYTGISGRDSIYLVVERFPNVVTGRLTYNFSEKDDNNGTIDGKISGDTLFADYTFISEGRSSVREVAFLLKDSTATEGYGPVEEKEGKMIFTDRHKLNFSNAIVLQLTSCVEQ